MCVDTLTKMLIYQGFNVHINVNIDIDINTNVSTDIDTNTTVSTNIDINIDINTNINSGYTSPTSSANDSITLSRIRKQVERLRYKSLETCSHSLFLKYRLSINCLVCSSD